MAEQTEEFRQATAMNGDVVTQPKKEIGQSRIRPDKKGDESLLSQFVAAVAAGDRELVFSFAQRLVGAITTPPGAPARRGDELLPVEEVARRLDISTRSISRHLADPNGDFPRPRYVGGVRKWSPNDISNYMAAGKGKRRR